MRHLTKDELVALLSVSEPQDRLIFLLAFNHGCESQKLSAAG